VRSSFHDYSSKVRQLGSWVAKDKLERRSRLFLGACNAADCARMGNVVKLLGLPLNFRRVRSRGLPTYCPSRSAKLNNMTERRLTRTFALACKSVIRSFQRQQVVLCRTYTSIGPQASNVSTLSWREYLALRSSKRKWQVVGAIFSNVKNRLSCSYRPRRFLAPSWVSPGVLLISEILTQIRLK